MVIYVEETPNPATLKFVLSARLSLERSVHIASEEEAKEVSPLALRLFGIAGISAVFIAPSFISVSKQTKYSWEDLQEVIVTELMTYIKEGGEIIYKSSGEEDSASLRGGADDDVSLRVKDLLNDRVRPAIAMDGGDVIFQGFHEGVVYLQLQGACVGCPSATATLKIGIENMLRFYIEEVQEVRAVE